jgi:hypothetical protein
VEPLRDRRFEVIPLTVPLINATTVIVGRAVWVYGFAFRAAGGVAADIDVLAGTDANADELAPITLGAGETMRDRTCDGGVFSNDGVTVKVNSGSVTGSLWIVYADM